MNTVPSPILTARLVFVPGVDRNEILITRSADVAGFDEVVATTSWQPAGEPGVASWDRELERLGYQRTSPWRPSEGGFQTNVQPLKQ